MTTDRAMPLFDHIKEMRKRLFTAVITWIVGTILASTVVEPLVSWLKTPLGRDALLIVTNPTEAPVMYFKVALAAGFALALPVILYQIYAFIAPGLYPSERSILLFGIPAVLVLFLLGALFTMEVLIPTSMPVLMGFFVNVVTPTYTLQNYISFVTTLVVWMGLLFQTPLVLYVISRLGLMTAQQLAKARRIVWFLAVLLAAVVTPTTDPVTLLLVTGPFILLYEIGLLLARVGTRQRRGQVSEDAEVETA